MWGRAESELVGCRVRWAEETGLPGQAEETKQMGGVSRGQGRRCCVVRSS